MDDLKEYKKNINYNKAFEDALNSFEGNVDITLYKECFDNANIAYYNDIYEKAKTDFQLSRYLANSAYHEKNNKHHEIYKGRN